MDKNLTNYKIVHFDEIIGQIIVKYDEVDHFIPLDLHPDENGLYMEGEQLDDWIRNACPIGFITRKNLINEGIKNIDAIRSLVIQDESFLPKQEEVVEERPQSTLPSEDVLRLIDMLKQEGANT